MPVSSDIIASVKSRGVQLDKFEDDVAARVRSILEEFERGLLADLEDFVPGPGSSRKLKQARLKALADQVRLSLDSSYTAVIDHVHDAMVEAAADELVFSAEYLTQALAPLEDLAAVNTVAISPEALRSLAADTPFAFAEQRAASPVADWFRSQQSSVQQSLLNQLQQGFLRGEGTAEIGRRISGGGAHDGVLPIGRKWGEAVARTSVAAVTNAARDMVYRKNPDVVKGVFQVSTRDERTTIICIAYHMKAWLYRDGALVPDGHDLPYNGGIPRHIRCRSVTSGIVKSWQEMGFSEDELSPALQNLFDGKIPAETGDSLLRSKGTAYQDKTLGVERAKLWREGKLSLREMLDDKGNVIRLDELGKAKSPKIVAPAPKVDRVEHVVSQLKLHPAMDEAARKARLAEREAIPASDWRSREALANAHTKITAAEKLSFKSRLAELLGATSKPTTLLGSPTKGDQEAASWLSSVFSRWDDSIKPSVFTTKSARAFCKNRKEIFLNNTARSATMVHELGHLIEDRFPEIKKAAQAFRARRVEGQKVSYHRGDKNEPIIGDKFIDPYMGKFLYREGSTEVTSVGLEWMYKDPVMFLQKDPETFAFILQLLLGE